MRPPTSPGVLPDSHLLAISACRLPPGFALHSPHSSCSLDWPKASVFPERVFLRKDDGIRKKSGYLTVPAPFFALNRGKINVEFVSQLKQVWKALRQICAQTPVGALLDFLQQSDYFLFLNFLHWLVFCFGIVAILESPLKPVWNESKINSKNNQILFLISYMLWHNPPSSLPWGMFLIPCQWVDFISIWCYFLVTLSIHSFQ